MTDWPPAVERLLREPDPADLDGLPAHRVSRHWETCPAEECEYHLAPDTVVRARRWVPVLVAHDRARVVGRARILRDAEGVVAVLDLRRQGPPVNGLSWAIRYSADDDGRLRLVHVEEVSLARIPANLCAAFDRGAFLGPLGKLGLS